MTHVIGEAPTVYASLNDAKAAKVEVDKRLKEALETSPKPVELKSLGAHVIRWVKRDGNEGNAQDLIDWYNAGADGAIDWGSDGDFEQCVAIAGQYIDNPEGFCNLRHQDATGAPPGKAPGEKEDKSTELLREVRSIANGKPSRTANVVKRFLAPMIDAYKAKSAASIGAALSALYVASYAAGVRSAASGVGGAAITSGVQADDTLAPMLDEAADLTAITADNAPDGLAALLGNVTDIAGNILNYMTTDGAPSDVDQATQMTMTEASSGAEAGAQDAASAGGFEQMQSVLDDTDACDICADKEGQPYDIGDDGPPWHPRCACESEPVGATDDDTEQTSAYGRHVRRWTLKESKRDDGDFEVELEDREVSAEMIAAIELRIH
jgi:hypothetical protein